MTFKEKIDKILRVNKLNINSPSGLEQAVKASVGAINKYYAKDEEPGEGTIKKILDLPGLNKEWWETGEGEVFITPVKKPSDNKEKMNPEEVYRNLVESNTEYRLIPKIILDQYEIIPKRELEERAEIVRVALAAKNDVIAELKKEISELRASRQVHVPAQQA